MNLFKKFSCAGLVLCSSVVWGVELRVGQREVTFKDPTRKRTLVATVWYPVDVAIPVSEIKSRGPFKPINVAIDGPIAKTITTKLPIVLLSHGSGGTADKLFWLADHLARKGIVVLGVNHPGNMTGDNSADGMMRIWDRALDLSFALDKLVEDKNFSGRLDLSRISAAGHSAGGSTVLLLAGARFEAKKFINPMPECRGSKDPYYQKICEQAHQLDMKIYPRQVVEGKYTDARIKSVAALDPGFARAFNRQSLKHLQAKAIVVVAGTLSTPQDEIYSKEFLTILPPQQGWLIPEAYHMTFLTACKRSYPKDDPELQVLCAGNNDKVRIQTEVATKSLALFRESWNARK